MWRNYLTVGVRALIKSRTYALINILGLAIGLAACVMILLYIRYEESYDKWLPNAENVYQFQTLYSDPTTGEPYHLQMAAYVSQAALKKDFPQIETTAYILSGSPTVLRDGEAVIVENGVWTDTPLFDVLQFPLLQGDPRTALAAPGAVALAKSEALRLLGTERALGKTITLVQRGERKDYRVTAVYDDVPKNTHLRPTMIVRLDIAQYMRESPDFLTNWGWQSGWVYLRLKPGTDPMTIERQFGAWEKRNIKDEFFGSQRYNAGDDMEFHLQRITDVHLGEVQRAAFTPGNDRTTIVTFAIIAVLILAMACVNFTNLATARAGQRAREVALRKVLGATRRQLILQFLGESVLVAAIAMLLALTITELALPPLSNFLGADLDLNYFGEGGLILPLIGLVLLVGAAGGVYPAFYLSRFQPAQILKANKSTAEAQGSGRLRGVLVVSQFAISIGLIICTAIVYLQTVYARTSDPGYQRDGLLQVERLSARVMIPQVDAFMREVSRLPGVKSVGRTEIGINTQNNMNTGVVRPELERPANIGWYAVDPTFFKTMGIETVAGRLFDPNRPMDEVTEPYPEDKEAVRQINKRGFNVVLNELAVKRLGFRSPQEAIGQVVRPTAFDADVNGLPAATIIGVVRDTRQRSIRSPIDPMMLRYDRIAPNYLLVRYEGNPAELRERIGRIWRRMAPDIPYEARFSEEIVADLYEAEQARAITFAGFAVLAVIVACLGLFGLAAFTAERRTKEIGIRKVLGARTRDIVRLLVWQFSKPVVIANLIAWPIAWWLMRDWLNTFDARIALTPMPFVLAGLLALVIAIGTIGAHAYRVARENPVKALRYE